MRFMLTTSLVTVGLFGGMLALLEIGRIRVDAFEQRLADLRRSMD
jgi:hypothetical protein